MNIIDEVKAGLIRDRDYWMAKSDRVVANIRKLRIRTDDLEARLSTYRDQGARCDRLHAENDKLADRIVVLERSNTALVDRSIDLMDQNDELSDRIHLDLDPRVKNLTECNDNQRVTIQNLFVNQRALRAEIDERDLKVRGLRDTIAIQIGKENDLIAANDVLEDRISVQKGAIKAYQLEVPKLKRAEFRLARIHRESGRNL